MSGQRHRKHVGLQRPARAVVGDVAHDQPRRHHGKAEVICHWQPGFQLVENAWNNFRQVAFWNITTFCHRQLGAIFQVFIVSSSSTLCMSRMFILVLPHKENKLHPIYRTIKSQDNFNKYQQHTKLWFAWKIVLLQYRKQRHSIQLNLYCRCDLLEKSYFCSIANNPRRWQNTEGSVVICLKNRTFAVSQTTDFNFGVWQIWLWFAWKIVLLQYRKQHTPYTSSIDTCCDLLEKSYFCSIANNTGSWPSSADSVVICLKNRTFAVSQTTPLQQLWRADVLWFAWKIVLLQYRKQL